MWVKCFPPGKADPKGKDTVIDEEYYKRLVMAIIRIHDHIGSLWGDSLLGETSRGGGCEEDHNSFRTNG